MGMRIIAKKGMAILLLAVIMMVQVAPMGLAEEKVTFVSPAVGGGPGSSVVTGLEVSAFAAPKGPPIVENRNVRIGELRVVTEGVDVEYGETSAYTYKIVVHPYYRLAAEALKVTIAGVEGFLRVWNQDVFVLDPAPTSTPLSVDTYTVKLHNLFNEISGVTFIYGTFDVIPAIITVTPDEGQSKEYGDADPVLAYGDVKGAKNGETPAFDGALGRDVREDVGIYDIVRDTLVLKSEGTFDASNYTLVVEDETFAITPATITVTPDAGQGKVYGDADPVLKYDYTDGKNGEKPGFKDALSREAGEDVGAYDILEGNLELKDNGTFKESNYILVVAKETFGIIPATITITPVAQKKAYGTAADPALTYGYMGAKNGEIPAFDGVLTRDLGEKVGTYSILRGTLALADRDPFKKDNYTLQFNPGVFIIYGQLIYHLNDGTDTVVWDLGEYMEGDPIGLVEINGVSWSRPGYVFAGWTLDPAGQNPVLANTVVMGEESVHVYAQWTAVSQYHNVTIQHVSTKTGLAISPQTTRVEKEGEIFAYYPVSTTAYTPSYVDIFYGGHTNTTGYTTAYMTMPKMDVSIIIYYTPVEAKTPTPTPSPTPSSSPEPTATNKEDIAPAVDLLIQQILESYEEADTIALFTIEEEDAPLAGVLCNTVGVCIE